jgi:FPC/CPF motif-containing protein YcgG
MYEQGLITQEDLAWLKERIKEEMPEWVATMNRYDDPSITDMEDVWGF